MHMNNLTLQHHGILGMRWGIRRYQNPDGTLTDAGKRRQVKKERKQLVKNKSILSDQELSRLNNRMNQEDQLKMNYKKNYRRYGFQLCDAMKTVGITAATGVVLFAGRQALNAIPTSGLNMNEAGKLIFRAK